MVRCCFAPPPPSKIQRIIALIHTTSLNNNVELETNSAVHKVDKLKALNIFEKIKHVDVLEFVNFKLEKFDSIETIVNTKILEFAKSNFSNRWVHFEEGIIENNHAAGGIQSITQTYQKQ